MSQGPQLFLHAKHIPRVDGVETSVARSEPSLSFLAVADSAKVAETAGPACQMAIDLVRAHLSRNGDLLSRFTRHPTEDLRSRLIVILKEAFLRADQETTALGRRHKQPLPLSLDVAVLVGNEAFVAHVGSGRIVMGRGGLLHRLTVDHLESAGALKAADAPPEPSRELEATPVDAPLQRAIGVGQKPEIETLCIELNPGDQLFLANRALTFRMSDFDLRDALAGSSAGEITDTLFNNARHVGTRHGLAVGMLSLGGATPTMDARLDVLARMPLFAYCTNEELIAVAAATRPRRCRTGDLILREGTVGREMFLLVSGELAVEKDGAVIATIEAGNTIGEMSLLDAPTASATVRACTDGELLVIARDAFFALLKRDSTFAVKVLWNMLLRLSANLRSTSARLAEVTGIEDGD